MTLRACPPFLKEGKVLIYNNLTFSSSSEESLSRFSGKYPRVLGGEGVLFETPSEDHVTG
jgi:hypothetical protein